MINDQPLNRHSRSGLIEPTDEEFAALMELWVVFAKTPG